MAQIDLLQCSHKAIVQRQLQFIDVPAMLSCNTAVMTRWPELVAANGYSHVSEITHLQAELQCQGWLVKNQQDLNTGESRMSLMSALSWGLGCSIHLNSSKIRLRRQWSGIVCAKRWYMIRVRDCIDPSVIRQAQLRTALVIGVHLCYRQVFSNDRLCHWQLSLTTWICDMRAAACWACRYRRF